MYDPILLPSRLCEGMWHGGMPFKTRFSNRKCSSNVVGIPKNPLTEQLVAIAVRLDSLESHFREDIAFLKTHFEPSSNQVKKEAPDDNHNDEEDRFKPDTEEISGDHPSDDEDQFQNVVGGQLEVCDGNQLKIEDLEKTQSHVEWLPTSLPLVGPILMISWTDRKEKWAEPDG
ncbi:hypothetical protein E3N88_00517 [Mikania micrantha]|uniref:Uncharacterized protein n=1 Tax=Mikania micrantha TaxID=192012 RepID=A0A5N6Q087_9ASTR|nr:hypothetical protein E3N88_00517 [Mikania micrantha]